MAFSWAIAAMFALVCSAAAREAAPDTELVVAHFKEDLSWVAMWKMPGVRLRVYMKGDVPASIAAERLPNVGRESHTYLSHIVNNYNSLAKWTVFTQGAAPRWGYRHGDSSSGHLTDQIAFADYVEPFRGGKDSFFALSTVAHLPSGIQSTRLGMLTDSLRSMSNALCPAGGPDGWSAWWVDEGHPHRKAGQRMLAFYNRYVLQNDATTGATLAPVTLAFAQGARFAVSRERILKRPRAYYKALLAQVSAGRDPLEGYFLEAMWHDVFHPERVQAAAPLCEYMPLPKSLAAMSHSEMFEDSAQRLTAKNMVSGHFDPRQLSDAYSPGVTEEKTLVATGNFSLEVQTDADRDLLISSAGLLGAAEALAGQTGVSPSSVVVTIAGNSSRRLQSTSNIIANLEFTITLTGGASDNLTTADEMHSTLTADSFVASFTTALNSVLAEKLGDAFGGVLSVASFAVASITATHDGTTIAITNATTTATTTTTFVDEPHGHDSFAVGRRGVSCVVGLLAAALALST